MKKVMIVVMMMAVSSILISQNAWINELHYDNTSTDKNEGVEIVIENPSSYTLSLFEVTFYNGNGGSSYLTKSLSEFTVGDNVDSYHIYYLMISGIQNGAPDGLALSYAGGLISGQFLSYEGTFTAVGGPADGVKSTDMGVSETESTSSTASLQLTGNGIEYSSFLWVDPAAATMGSLNNSQFFSATPTITVSESSLSGFTYLVGDGPSSEQSFTVEGSNLTADISLSAPTDYEISLGTGGEFAATNPLALTQSEGSVSSTTVYVRLKAGLSVGDYNNENVSASSDGATTKTVTCSGSVTSPGDPFFTATENGMDQINLEWLQNDNSDNVIVVFDLDGSFTDPVDGTSYSVSSSALGGTVLYNGSETTYIHGSLNEGTHYYYKAWSVDGSNHYSSGVTDDATTLSSEPSNHVTNLLSDTGDPSHSTIDIIWDDATGATIPTGYLIKGSSTGYAGITVPVDGTPEDDGNLIFNVSAGVEFASFSSLDAETSYYFKVYPYTNTGDDIDYKTDGTVPETSTTTAAVPVIPALMISEVADPSDEANAKFVELYNASGSDITFASDWYLCRQANGGSWGDIELVGTIGAGQTFLIAYSLSTFESTYGFAADQYSVSISGNGNDGYFLYYSAGHTTGTLVDAYGVIDEDGTGKPWEYLDSHAVRLAGVNEPNATWTAAEWTIESATATQCSPGDTTLPVTLSSFTVSAVMNSYINVEWSTASESQLNCFNVWRDGEVIGSVEATNTTQTQFYSFADHQAAPGNTYHYWLEVVELDGSTTMFGPQSVTLEQQGEPGQPAIPQVYGLYQNYPNPFNPSTEISFSVPGTTTGELVVYACNGQLVKRLYQGQINAQEVYRITWDGTDSSGKSVASGLYFYRLQTEKASLHKKMILIQ
jgi:hypothetical protein